MHAASRKKYCRERLAMNVAVFLVFELIRRSSTLFRTTWPNEMERYGTLRNGTVKWDPAISVTGDPDSRIQILFERQDRYYQILRR